MTRLKLYLFFILTIVTSIGYAQDSSRILVMGDSLSAGYGMQLKESWVSLLEAQLKPAGKWDVINASVSGETTSGGKARLQALLEKHQPQIVILELGGNDGLRGQPLKMTRANLQTMIDLSLTHHAQVLLIGMQIPPNYGARYTKAFAQLYSDLAQQNNIELVPFLLAGVAGNANLMQADGIHANVKAQPIVLQNVFIKLEPMLEPVNTIDTSKN